MSGRSSSKSSNASGRQNSATITKPHAIRSKPLPNDTRRPQTPPSTDENSLTSFPALSPSLANSPVDSPQNTHRFHSLSVPTAGHTHSESQNQVQHGALHGLFAGMSPGEERSSLFEDTPKNIRHIPGTLHLQSDRNLEHVIQRVGAITLVKRMAEDLAQRDAQITQLQRRAEERERLLRRMLRECEVSNLKIENRLKELQLHQREQEQSRNVSGNSQASESGFQSDISIDEQLSEAFGDIVSGGESGNAAKQLQYISKANGSDSHVGSRQASGELSRRGSLKGRTVRKSETKRGWKSYFIGQGNQKRNSDTVRGPLERTASAQERLNAIHTASQANLRRQGLHNDIHKSPSSENNANGTTTPDLSKQQQSAGNIASDARSTKSTNSFTSWASKLVGVNSQSSDHDQMQDGTTTGKSQSNGNDTSPPNRINTNANRTRAASLLSSQATKSTTDSTGASKASTDNKADARTNVALSTSPEEQVTHAQVSPGPMEMDTILPDHTRPPTLLPYEITGDHSEYLTDRYGFIYDQRRRARQNVPVPTANRNKRGSRLETLENHRRSWHSLATKDTDNVSLNSHKSNENADPSLGSPAVDSPLDTHAPKKWQDYLKLSSLSSELLSHTPSVAATTDIITGAEETLEQKPQIKVSERGSIVAPSSNPAPSPSHVISSDAEFAQSNDSDATSTTAIVDQTLDPVKALLDQLTEIHDASQREKETRWNEFLRKIRSERHRQGENSDRRPKGMTTVPEASWMDGEIIGVTSVGNEGKAGRAKWIEFKNLVLGGIPLSLRPKVWSECSGALALRIPGYYDELADSHSEDETIVAQIAMDIPRTLTDNIYFRKGDGMGKLSRVLLTYAQRNPEVGYCQGMNLIAANLLLIMPTAEDAFWMLATLIEKILPDKYYDHSLLTSRADQAVLRQYVGTVLPKLSSHLDELSIDLEALTFQWFLSVFTDCLSAEALFRVWDVILCTPPDAGGGATFLFQIALALLKLNERELLACETSAEVYAYINGKMTDHAISIDGLIKASEALRRVVKKEEVERKRGAVVQADLEMARAREAIRKGKAKAKDPEPSLEPTDDSLANEERKDSGDGEMEGLTARPPSESIVDADEYRTELQLISPLPVEEEAQWRA